MLVYALIAINAAVFLYQIVQGQQGMQEVVYRYGVVPYYLAVDLHAGSLITPFTSMFMHGGWMHIIGNMWFLWVFGDNLEDALGKAKFIAFYLVCGIAAAAGQILVDPSSKIPMVGASGSISGVLAGYVMLYPQARVLTLVPIFIFLQFVELPAFLFIFIWFGFQLLQGVASLGVQSGGGVAFFAHIGGFVAGLAMVRFLIKRGGPKRPMPPSPPGPRFDRDRFGL